MKKKLVGGYIRVSTERQVEGYSIEGQITQIEQYCQFNGYELVDICRSGYIRKIYEPS